MKKLLIGLIAAAVMTGPAFAADMPVKAPVYKAPPVVQAFSWTGFYIGAHGGYMWSDKDWTETCSVLLPGACTTIGAGGPILADNKPRSAIFGAQAGYNWQTNNWVWGVEAQGSWADANNCNPTTGNTGGFFAVGRGIACTHVNALGSVALRLGMAWDRTLLFVKGGGAFAHENYVILCGTGACGGVAVGAPLTTNPSDTRFGWMVGGGIEYAFTDNWSAKVEYNYMDFGSRTYNFTTIAPAGGNSTHNFEIEQRIQLVKAGINYRFGGPIAARY